MGFFYFISFYAYSNGFLFRCFSARHTNLISLPRFNIICKFAATRQKL